MKVIALLQARVSSSRLPGKVLKPLMGQAMIVRQIERINRSERIDKLVVATSDEQTDDDLANLLEQLDISVFRGDLNNVLDRYYRAAQLYQPEHIVRLTADCPLIDPKVIDLVIAEHLKNNTDYTSNTLTRSYPDGLDVEVLSFNALEKAWRQATLQSEQEHVTPFIRNHSELFSQHNVANDQDFSDMRWTVDIIEDFNLIEQIYEALYLIKPEFSTQDVLQLIKERPELKTINKVRNE